MLNIFKNDGFQSRLHGSKVKRRCKQAHTLTAYIAGSLQKLAKMVDKIFTSSSLSV